MQSKYLRPTKNQILVALALEYHWNAISYNGCLLIAENGQIRDAAANELYYALRKGFDLTINNKSLLLTIHWIWYWYNGANYSTIPVNHNITLKLAELVHKNWYSICDKLYMNSGSRQDAPEWIKNLEGYKAV